MQNCSAVAVQAREPGGGLICLPDSFNNAHRDVIIAAAAHYSLPLIGTRELLISTAIVAAIGSGEAFERGRDFAAWLGLVPRQYSTGGRSILGRISKRGSKYLRTLLIQAAKVLLMRPHNWGRYSFGPWLNSASERLHRNKLAVALANKLARIAWSVLRNDKAFDTHLGVAAI